MTDTTLETYKLGSNTPYPVSSAGLAQCAIDDLIATDSCVASYLNQFPEYKTTACQTAESCPVTDTFLQPHIGKTSAEILKSGFKAVALQSIGRGMTTLLAEEQEPIFISKVGSAFPIINEKQAADDVLIQNPHRQEAYWVPKGMAAEAAMNAALGSGITYDSQNSITQERICTGKEVSNIPGSIENIPNYNGDFPSPFPLMWYAPENDEILKTYFSPQEIRKWVNDACIYHGIPYVILAAILQNENVPPPEGEAWKDIFQFGERSATTALAILDAALWDSIPDQMFGKRISSGSSGLVNLSRQTLVNAAKYTENVYGKPPLPEYVRYRLLGWDQDTRIPGDDAKADLYYAAAHIRELIDRTIGTTCHSGTLSLEQVSNVIGAYNGSGEGAKKYAIRAMENIQRAVDGQDYLYFYQVQN
jgi:hypothetical protein